LSVPNRFERELEVWEPTEGTSRFERLDKGLPFVASVILQGKVLGAQAKEGRILVSLEASHGLFPSFEMGVASLGEALLGEPLADVPGACSGVDPIDRFLLDGGKLAVHSLGNRLHALLVQDLAPRTFMDKGTEHEVYRKGTRKGQGDNVLAAVQEALGAHEDIMEGSLLPR